VDWKGVREGEAQAQRFQNLLSRRVGMASVGGPLQSGHGPVERAGVMNFAGHERANLTGVNAGQAVRSTRGPFAG
jgi:hypothetical protein